jgi:hypothetical protein
VSGPPVPPRGPHPAEPGRGGNGTPAAPGRPGLAEDDVPGLLARLAARDVRVAVAPDGATLTVDAPAGELSEAEWALLAAHKPALLALLAGTAADHRPRAAGAAVGGGPGPDPGPPAVRYAPPGAPCDVCGRPKWGSWTPGGRGRAFALCHAHHPLGGRPRGAPRPWEPVAPAAGPAESVGCEG